MKFDARTIAQLCVSLLLILNTISLTINLRRLNQSRVDLHVMEIFNAFEDRLISEIIKDMPEDIKKRHINNARIIFNNLDAKKFGLKEIKVEEFEIKDGQPIIVVDKKNNEVLYSLNYRNIKGEQK